MLDISRDGGTAFRAIGALIVFDGDAPLARPARTRMQNPCLGSASSVRRGLEYARVSSTHMFAPPLDRGKPLDRVHRGSRVGEHAAYIVKFDQTRIGNRSSVGLIPAIDHRAFTMACRVQPVGNTGVVL